MEKENIRHWFIPRKDIQFLNKGSDTSGNSLHFEKHADNFKDF